MAANKEKAARVNPITYVTQDDPAFLIVHGDKDPVVPINQSQLLYDALKQAGVSVHFHTVKDAGHGTGFGGPAIQSMVGEFFDRVLKANHSRRISAQRRLLTASVRPLKARPAEDNHAIQRIRD